MGDEPKSEAESKAPVRKNPFKRTPPPPPEISTEVRVVALVDALGFRGIWKRHKSATIYRDVFGTLSKVRRAAEAGNRQKSFSTKEVELTIAGFSDTIILIGEPIDPTKANAVHVTLTHIAEVVAELMHAAARAELPLAYRGSIAVGEVAISDGMYVGEAIDEAAEWYEIADAAVVVLTPSARRVIEAGEPSPNIVSTQVPIKGHGSLSLYAVNPFFNSYLFFNSQDDPNPALDAILQQLRRPFDLSGSAEVERKRQNTERFLKTSRDYSVDEFGKVMEAYYEAQAEVYEAYDGKE
jgi:hypothetical protein